jgi:oligoribonuclease
MHKKKSATNLVWLDLEMTGLDHTKNHIIEIATVVTDKDLNVLANGPNLAIYQPQEYLLAMDAWCTKTHTNSGLVKRVSESKISVIEAERLTLEFLKDWVPANEALLCGNTIGTDRRFLAQYMPKLENFFHYRVIDVSTIKELAKLWRPDLKIPEKHNKHQAFDDILESIEELKYYTEKFIRKHI